jgi:hypothetical protein
MIARAITTLSTCLREASLEMNVIKMPKTISRQCAKMLILFRSAWSAEGLVGSREAIRIININEELLTMLNSITHLPDLHTKVRSIKHELYRLIDLQVVLEKKESPVQELCRLLPKVNWWT